MSGRTESRGGVQWKRLLALLGIYVFGNVLALAFIYLLAELRWLVFLVYAVPVMFTAVPALLLVISWRSSLFSDSEETLGWAVLLHLVTIGTWLFVLWLWWENARYYFLG